MSRASTAVGSAFAAQFRALMTACAGSPQSDGELLQSYVSAQDQEAFAELVRRLGPSVWSVCCRYLREGPDAEDAFQATFLVLARKATGVKPPGRVAAWLYGVANLAAKKARASQLRRQARVRTMAEVPDQPARNVETDGDLGPALHEELNRLPDKFRVPLVLCGLRDLTTAQAASELGWPVGTVASRLSRGRSLLTDRLVRRGAAPAALAALAPLAAAVPIPLISQTISLAVPVAGAAAGSAFTLSSEVIRAMTISKLNLFGLGLAAAALVALGGGVLMESRMNAAPPTAADKSAAVDPLDRFKLEGLMVMLKPEEIQKEIGLSAEQVKSLDEARTEKMGKLEEEMRKMFQGPGARVLPVGPGPGGARIVAAGASGVNPVMAELQAAFDKTAIGVLKPEQQRRLRQVYVQIQGPTALLDRRVIRALELTIEQEDNIDADLAAIRKFAGDQEKYVEESEKVMAAATKHLNSEQKTKWEKLTGKALAGSDLVKANPRFNPVTKGIAGKGGVIFGGAGPALPPPVQPPPPPQ